MVPPGCQWRVVRYQLLPGLSPAAARFPQGDVRGRPADREPIVCLYPIGCPCVLAWKQPLGVSAWRSRGRPGLHDRLRSRRSAGSPAGCGGDGKALVMVPPCSLGPRTGQVASNALLLCVALRSSNQRTNRSSDSSRMWHSYRWAEGKEALPVLTEEKQPAGGTSRARPLPLGRMPGVSAGSWCPERTPLGQWELVVA